MYPAPAWNGGRLLAILEMTHLLEHVDMNVWRMAFDSRGPVLQIRGTMTDQGVRRAFTQSPLSACDAAAHRFCLPHHQASSASLHVMFSPVNTENWLVCSSFPAGAIREMIRRHVTALDRSHPSRSSSPSCSLQLVHTGSTSTRHHRDSCHCTAALTRRQSQRAEVRVKSSWSSGTHVNVWGTEADQSPPHSHCGSASGTSSCCTLGLKCFVVTLTHT